MTSDVERRPAPPLAPTITGPSLISRVYGFGSIYGKTMRDSRRAVLIEISFLAGFMLVILAGVGTVYASREARAEIVRIAVELGPAGGGLVGPIVDVGTMGGYVGYRYGVVFAIVAALWSIIALTGTLAGESRRGSLDILAATPFGRRRIATEKVAAHLVLLAITTAAVTVSAWAGSAAFATLRGDEIPLEAAAGFALWIGTLAVFFGGFAFALSPFLGRAAAAWIAGFILICGPLLINFRSLVPGFEAVFRLTPWWWTWTQAAALAGRYDWPSLIPAVLSGAAFILVGVEGFARRDIGASIALPRRIRLVRVPVLGLRGAFGRSLSERLPISLAWGIGAGAFAFLVAGSAGRMADRLAASPDLLERFRIVFPNLDVATAGGFLQLAIQLLFIAVGFAAATLVAGWASDETSGRLEMVLGTPLGRARWALTTCFGVLASIAFMTAIVAVGVGAGVAGAGEDPIGPRVGTVVLGLFAAAMAGIGVAVGGVVRASFAADTVMIAVVATYLVDVVVPALGLPADLRQLAITAHLGRPMVGAWDLAGMAACVTLAVGGSAVAAWGLARRDVGR